jgi:hypothetical protein
MEPGQEEDAAHDHGGELDERHDIHHLGDRDQLVDRAVRARRAQEPEGVDPEAGDPKGHGEPEPARGYERDRAG